MNTAALTFTAGTGRTAVTLTAQWLGQDLLLVLTAGRAHVGATALAVPCPLTAEGVNASVSVLTVPGHRDDVAASALALRVCKILQRPVTVTAGLHLNRATPEEIALLLQNSQQTADLLLQTITC